MSDEGKDTFSIKDSTKNYKIKKRESNLRSKRINTQFIKRSFLK